MSEAWLAIEHKFRSILKQHDMLEADFFVAHSGGLDSVCLFQLLLRCSDSKKIKVFHYHHGPSLSAEVQTYRDKALAFVGEQVRVRQQEFKVELSFESEIYDSKKNSELPSELQSENDFREARMSAIQARICAQEILVTAHHQDDELETDLIKLIRGSGPDGFSSFGVSAGSKFRPLLEFSKKELREYAEKMNLQWLEDPSNASQDYLRNWIRNHWLPELDNYQAGSVQALGRSLRSIKAHILESKNSLENKLYFDTKTGVERSYFLTLSRENQKLLLARYLRSLDVRNFTQNHLNEILKHLDNPKNEHTFIVASCQWSVNAEQIVAEKLALTAL